jgi:hypothetical protein
LTGHGSAEEWNALQIGPPCPQTVSPRPDLSSIQNYLGAQQTPDGGEVLLDLWPPIIPRRHMLDEVREGPAPLLLQVP